MWLAYYLLVIPLLIMWLVPLGDAAPRWFFLSVIAAATAGVALLFTSLAGTS